jgi:hypothetical protein
MRSSNLPLFRREDPHGRTGGTAVVWTWRPRKGPRPFRPARCRGELFEQLEQRLAPALTFQFDTSYDTSNFFNQNPRAITVLQQAAQILGGALNDNLGAIAPGGSNTWTASFFDPSNPSNTDQVQNLSVPANTLVVYVGGAPLGSNYLGEGAPGSFSSFGTIAWNNLVASRGQAGALASPATDFGPWGGSLTFDTSVNWSFSGTGGSPGFDQVDFLSVALHELGHVLGYGTANSWFSWVNGTSLSFHGPHGDAVYGGLVPLDPGEAHWADGTVSGGSITVMNPSIGPGVRRVVTPLDWAGLADIGWNDDQLVVTAPPPSVVTAGSGFGMTVTAEYPDGAVDTTYSGLVTLTVTNNTGGATLGGTVTATAQNGVATFSALTLDKAGSGYTIQASAAGLSPATTSISVTPSAVTRLVVTSPPPSTVMAGAFFGVAVAAEDGFGNINPNYTTSMSISAAGATLGPGATSVSTVAGVATFSNLTLTQVASYALGITSGALSVSAQLNIVAAPATQLVVTAQPAFGQATAQAALNLGSLAALIITNGGGGYLSAPLVTITPPGGTGTPAAATATLTNGVVTALRIVIAGSGYTTAPTVTIAPPSATASAVANVGAGMMISGFSIVSGGAGYSIAPTVTIDPPVAGTRATATANVNNGVLTGFTITNPGSGYATAPNVTISAPVSSIGAGTAFGLTVQAEDPYGNVNLTYGTNVTVALGSNPAGGTLGGVLSATPASGVAMFSGLSLVKAGSGYTLNLSSGSLTPAVVGPLTVTPTAPTQLVVTTPPPGSVPEGTGFGLVVTAEDGNGNTATGFSGNVTLSLGNNPGGAVLGGVSSVTAAGGVASFTGLTLNALGAGYTLKAASTGLTPATTSAITVTAATATHLVITTQPPASVTAGTGFGLTVAAEDGFGNVDPSFNSNIMLALASNPGGTTLGGTVTLTAAGGTATFSGLTLNTAAIGYMLQASSSGLTPATTSSLTVNAAPATHLAVTTEPPASLSAGTGFSVVVAAEDPFGNPDPGVNGSATLSLSANPGGSTLGGTTTVPVVGGVATFANLTLNKVASGYVLQAAFGSFPLVTTSSISVNPAPATQLVVTTQPPATLVNGVQFGLVVKAEDSFGNIDPSFSGQATVSIGNNPGGGRLAGTTQVGAASGVITYSSLFLFKAGTGYTLKVASGTLTPATTTAITVTPGPADRLQVTTQPPSSIPAGVGFGLVVAAEDSGGDIDPTYTGAVTLALSNNPGGSTFGGTLTVNASAGVATFTGLTLNKPGNAYAIRPTSGTFSTVTNEFNVGPAPATQLVVTTQPPGSFLAGTLFNVVITAEDGLGNVDTGFSSTVALALANNPGGASLIGTASVTASAGIATFSGLTLNRPGSGYTLQATSGGLAPATTGSITVSPALATHLAVTTQPPLSTTAGIPFGLVVAAEDGFGNVDPSYTGSVTLALAANPGGTSLGGVLTATASSGVATFSGLTLNAAASGYTVQASGGTLAPATTESIAVSAAPATHLVLTTRPPATATAGAGFGLAVSTQDGFGNVDLTYNGNVTLALAANPGGAGAVLGGTTVAAVTSGIATFSGVFLNKAAAGYTLQASAAGLTPVTTASLTINAAPATHLVIATQPPASVTAGSSFGLVVSAQDPFGNVDPSFSTNIQVGLASNPGMATLGGTTSLAPTAGGATFSGLTLNVAATGYKLSVFSGSLTGATSSTITVTPALATHLAITTPPPASVTAGTGFGLVVAAEDSFGNIDPTYGNAVALTLTGNPGGSMLGGTTSLTASAGVAAFAGLSLNKAASGYVLGFSSGSLAGTSSTLSVTAAAATHLAVSVQPPVLVKAGSGFGLTVTAADPFGNVDTSFTGNVMLALANNPGGTTLGGTTSVMASGGVAVFPPGLTLSRAAGGYTLSASSAPLIPATTNPLTVSAAAATHLVVTTQPPATVSGGAGFGLVVSAEDGFGNVDASYQGNVGLVLASGPGGAVLGGTTTLAASAGVAAFAGLSLNQSGSGYTLQATSGTLTPALSSSVNVTASAATHLAITTQPPGTVTAGTTFGVVVSVRDGVGNVDPTYNGSITLALANNPGGPGAALGGTVTLTTTSGVATFSDLTLNRPGTGYTLQATSGSLTPATTNAINVGTAPAAQLAVISQPPAHLTAGSSFGVVIAAEDSAGNVDPSYSGQVTLTLASSPVGAVLGGTTTVAAVAGVATFSALTLTQVAAGEALQAASGSFTPVFTSSVGVSAAPATHLAVTTQPPAGVVAGVGFGLAVSAEDPFGNVDPTFAGTVALTLTGNPGGSNLGGTTSLAAGAGVATFTGLTLNRAAAGYLLTVGAAGLSSATSNTFGVNAAPATHLAVTTQPPASVAAGGGFGLVVSAEDGFGNVDPTYKGNVTLSVASNPGGSTLAGTLGVAASHGVATFSGLTLNQAGSGYTLLATDGSLASATTNSLNVTSATATHLAIVTQPPASITAGSDFGLMVAAEDDAGNVDPTFHGQITLALSNPPSGSVLGGTLALAASAGMASFSGLTLDNAAAGVALVATDGSLSSATTSSFTVTAAAATHLVVTSPPPASVTAGKGFGLVVAAEDSFGNVDPSFGNPIALGLSANPGGATLGGNTSVTPSAGVATFAGLTLNKAATGDTLAVSTSSLPPVTTSALNVSAAPATHLVFTTEPPSSVAAGGGFSVVVAAEDSFGNVDPTYNGAVTLALGSNPGAATLGGTLGLAASSGLATFTGVSLNRTASGYTLLAAGSSLASATSTTLNVTPAGATHLAITTQPPASVPAGSSFGLVVSAEDDAGNLDPIYGGTITLTLAANPTGTALGGTLTLPASGGVAMFTGLSVPKAAGGYTVTASGTGSISSATTSAFSVSARAATHLLVTTQPPASISAGSGFGMNVAAEDDLGNIDPTFSGSITLALLSNPGGDTLSGNSTLLAGSGVAAFSGLSLDRPGSGETLQATASGLTGATTSAFDVTASSARKLVVLTEPLANVTAGSGFTLTVAAEDALGNVDTSFNGSVTLALASNPGGPGAVLGGSATMMAAAGMATFNGLTLNLPARGYTLQAASGSLATATTTAIAVAIGPASQLVVTTQPPPRSTAGSGFGLVVEAEDRAGNVDPTYSGTVTLTLDLAGNPAGVALGGTLSVAAAGGVAAFSGLSVAGAAVGYTIGAASGSLAAATSNPFTVSPAQATRLVVTTPPPASSSAGSGFGLVVSAEDGFGNVDTGYHSNVALALAANPGGPGATLFGTTIEAAQNGVATFSGLALDQAAAGYTLQATSGSLTPATTAALAIAPAAAAELVITAMPPASVSAGSAFGLNVTVEDLFGNIATSFSSGINLSLFDNPGGPRATLGGTTTLTPSGGVAAFSDLTLNTAVPSPYVLEVSSAGLTAATTSGINVSPGAASVLRVTVPPPGSVTAGGSFGLTIAAEDAVGNVDTAYNGAVTLALANSPSGTGASGTLGGTTTVTAHNGLAGFTGLTLDQATAGAVLQATSGGLTAATTGSISVSAAPATHLAISTPPPASLNAGSGFGLTVAAEDSFGNVDPSFTGNMTLALSSGPGGATLGGTTTVPGSAGVATFSGLVLDRAAGGYTINVSSGSLPAVTTGMLTVSPAPATHLAITTAPPASVSAGTGFGLVVSAEDDFGNVDSSTTGDVVLSLASNPGGMSSTLGGTTRVAAVAGVATLTGLSLNVADDGYTVHADSGSLAGTTSGTIDVTPGPASQLVVTTEPPGNITAGGGFSLVVSAEDRFGNRVSGPGFNVTLSLASVPTGTGTSPVLGGTLTAAADSGVAVFQGLSLASAGSGYTVKASSGSLIPATTSSINVAAAAATQLAVTTEPPGSVIAGSGFGVVVAAEDVFGNVDPTYNGSVTLALGSNPPPAPGAALGGTTSVTAHSGVATFSALTLNMAASDVTLQAASGGLVPTSTTTIAATSAAATHLVITTPPPAAVTAGAGFVLAIAAEDDEGNVDPSFHGTVTLTLASRPAGSAAALGGNTTAMASGGLAAFSGLTLNVAAMGYVVQAASAGLRSATSGTIDVSAAPAAQLVVTAGPPASVTAGTGFGLTVAAEDGFGNIDTGFVGSVSLSLAGAPGQAAESLSAAPARSGVATFTGLVIDRAAAGYQVQAASGGLSPALSSPMTVTPGPAAQLVVTSGPPASVNAGSGFGLVVAAEDAFGNLATSFNGSETLSLASNPGGATLGGSTTVTAGGGMATFSGLTLDRPGSPYTIQVESSGLAPAVTGSIAVVAIAAPVTVQGISLQKVPAGKHKTTTVIVVQFSNALNASAAGNPGAYVLSTTPQGKKHTTKGLALARVAYNPTAHTATLTPAKKLVLKPPVQLRLSAASLPDSLGRPLDGNHDGQPGGDYIATLSNAGVTAASISPRAVDALIQAGFRPARRVQR